MFARRLRNAFFAAAVFACALPLAAAACSGKKNTELVVAIQTDMRVPKDLNAVTVEVYQSGRLISGDSYDVGPGFLHLPATIGIVPQDPNNLNPVDVVITGQFGSNYPDDKKDHSKVIRKARLTFAKDRVALVRMPLRFSCYEFDVGKQCVGGNAEDQTCVAGSCKPIPKIDGATLPDFSADKVFGAGGNGEGEVGECWDPAACMAAPVRLAETTTVSSTNECVFSLAGMSGMGGTSVDAGMSGRDAGAGFKALDPSKGLNVVVASDAANAPGFCNKSTCRVPLDYDKEEGWYWQDEVAKDAIVVAAGICTKLRAGAWLEASDACPTKTNAVPLCDVPAGDVGPEVVDAGGGDGGGSDASTDVGAMDAAPSDDAGAGDGGTSTDAGPSDPCGAPTTDPLRASFHFPTPAIGVNDLGSPLTPNGPLSSSMTSMTCPTYSLNLNGSSTWLDGSLASLSSIVNSFTISMYVSLSGSFTANRTLIALTDDTGAGIEIGTNASSQPSGTVAFSGGNVTFAASSATAPSGWHQLVVKWPGAGQPITATVDGITIATSSIPSGTLKPFFRASVGRKSLPTAGGYWPTPIGELRVYGK